MNAYRYFLYLTAVVILALSAIEIASFYWLKSQGIDSQMFIGRPNSEQVEGRDGKDAERFNTIDPHLGYTHGKNEKKVVEVEQQYTWVDGFLIYSKNISSLQRPIILALGGSTTDGVNYGHSWPEELSNILRDKGIPGTVINGGIGGYSSNQELFKLTRDGLEFHPDVVISYGGINDRGQYSELPYPMVHTYQMRLLKMITGMGSEPSPLFPSTIEVVRSFNAQKSRVDYTFGLPTSRSLAENYERNMKIMNVVSAAEGASFLAFIQPFAFYNSKHAQNLNLRKGLYYINRVSNLYNQITKLPNKYNFIIDATNILETSDNVYKPDGTHLTADGDRVVANYIFQRIKDKLH